MALPVTAAELRTKSAPGDIDPNVKIPKAVIAAGKQSEEIQRAILGQAEASIAEATAKAAAAANGETLPEGQPQPQPIPPPQGEPPPPEQPPLTPAAGAPSDWDQRLKSLHGRHTAEMKRQADIIQTLSERLARAEQDVRVARASAPIPSSNELPASSLTEQEIQEYGPDFVDVMRRVAAETAGPLNNEINRLRAQVGHVQQEAGNSFLTRMNQTIGAAVPNWAEINKHPAFVAWSGLPDVFSNAIRKTLMQDAWNSGDAQRVIAFFQAFLAEEAALHPTGGNGAARPAPRTVVSSVPIAPHLDAPAGPVVDLASLAAPGRAHSAGGLPAEKPVYTTAEITKFYTDVASGKWRGREQQQAAIDADIILAQRENRIILNQRTQLPMDPRTR